MKKMKRSIAAAILSMCVSGLPAFAAGNTAPSLSPAMDKLVKAELIRGNGQGVNTAYLDKHATRIQAAVLYLRLSGLEKEALAYQGTDTFKDAAQAGKVPQPRRWILEAKILIWLAWLRNRNVLRLTLH